MKTLSKKRFKLNLNAWELGTVIRALGAGIESARARLVKEPDRPHGRAETAAEVADYEEILKLINEERKKVGQ